MQFIFEQIRTGGDRNFGYLIGDRKTGAAVLVDPSYDPEQLVARAEIQSLKVVYILNTHGHHDHTNGNARAQELTGALLGSDFTYQDGQELALGELTLRILLVPGHARDHIAIFEPNYGVLLTGDLLFVGKVGGTKDEIHAHQQYDSLQHLYKSCPPETTVWPGHDYGCRPSSTLALEKATNPFLMASNVEEFCNLKASWASFKAEKGLK